MSTKKCGCCGKLKSLFEFGKNNARKDGVDQYCIVCRKEYQSNRRLGLDRSIETKKGREKDLDKARTKNRDEYHRNKRAYQNQRLIKNYGITLDEKENMSMQQNGVCAVCNKPGKLVVDHDHKTGKVRGLLHSSCNAAIGLLKEDVEAALGAARYLSTNGVF